MSTVITHGRITGGRRALHAAACVVAFALATPASGHAAALWLGSRISTYDNRTNGTGALAGSDFGLTSTGSTVPAMAGDTSDSFSATATASASVDMNRLTRGYGNGNVNWTVTFSDPFYAGQMALTTLFSGNERAYTNYYASSTAANNYLVRVLVNGVAVPLSWSGVQSTSTSCSLPPDFFEYTCERTNNRGNNGYTARFSVVNGDILTVSGYSDAYAYGNTDIGSAEASASNRLTWTLHAVPEPSSVLLLLTALAALWFARRHSRLPGRLEA